MPVNREEYKSESITFFTFSLNFHAFSRGEVSVISPKEKTAEISDSRRCAVRIRRLTCSLLLARFLSGSLLHMSFYLGFVRLSGCRPFFLLVRSQNAVNIVTYCCLSSTTFALFAALSN